MNFKLLFVLLWTSVIIVATCTIDAYAFLVNHFVKFDFQPDPSLSELLILNDINFLDGFYLIQKTGHFMSFGILFILVFYWLENKKTALLLCAGFAVFSEVLQLYFERDGRLFDAFIDFLGIFLAYIFCLYIKSDKRRTASS